MFIIILGIISAIFLIAICVNASSGAEDYNRMKEEELTGIRQGNNYFLGDYKTYANPCNEDCNVKINFNTKEQMMEFEYYNPIRIKIF